MTASRRSRPICRGRLRPIAAVALAAGLALSGVVGTHTASAGAVAASPYRVTVGSTHALSDGDLIPVAITSSKPATDPVGWVDIQICRPGIRYTSYAPVAKLGNCGFSPGSSAYASANGSAEQDFPGEPSGARSFPDNFVAGVGSASFAGHSLTCDDNHPCDLVVSVFTNETEFNEYQKAATVRSFTMTFAALGSIAGCKGTAADALQTVSSDRLVDAYTEWSRDDCTEGGPGGGEAPTENTFLDEGGPFGAVDSFASGDADLAYAAGGYDLRGFDESKGRPYVAVPVALNAVVVATSGGQEVKAYSPAGSIPPITKGAPYSHLQLTAGQAASLFGGGHVSTQQAAAIDAENPELGTTGQIVPYLPPGGSDTFIYPQAVAGVDATTVFASTYFNEVGGADWNSGPNEPAGKPENVRRGVITSFAQPGAGEPAFTSLGLYSHRTDLERSALPSLGVGPLPLWVLTDRATATEIGFTTVSLGARSATVVAPTEKTMDAAVADMTAEKDGTLQPDPTAADASATPAYPLTFVEYALAPTEPLVDASCRPRTASEKLLVQWLDYLTGKGQSDLAPGLEPLTTALRTQAARAIAEIGKAPATGTCAPTSPSTTVPPTTPTTPAPVAIPGSTGTVPVSPTTTSSTPAHGGHHTPRPVPPRSLSTHPGISGGPSRLAAVHLPRMDASSPTGWLLPSVALVLLALLTGGMALRAAGRAPLGAAVASVRKLRRRRRRP